jgi:hypothetical protein
MAELVSKSSNAWIVQAEGQPKTFKRGHWVTMPSISFNPAKVISVKAGKVVLVQPSIAPTDALRSYEIYEKEPEELEHADVDLIDVNVRLALEEDFGFWCVAVNS